jgi:hypothetical protein
MGWTESPPYFCVLTETVIDLVNERLGHWDPPIHPLETVASTPPPPPDDRLIHYMPVPGFEASLARHLHPREFPRIHLSTRRERKWGQGALAYGDVYVDDEILAAQGTASQLNCYRRIIFHTNDLVFRPNNDTNIVES